jgi:hypothetical protein
LRFVFGHETRYKRVKARQRWNATSGRVANEYGLPPDFLSSAFGDLTGIVFGEADPPFNFLEEQLFISNRETR